MMDFIKMVDELVTKLGGTHQSLKEHLDRENDDAEGFQRRFRNAMGRDHLQVSFSNSRDS